jgi:dTDP-4-dehydrorhamnose 3,5-epimerase
MDFNIQKSTKINDIYIIKPTISVDMRGDIWTSFLKDEIEKLLPSSLFFKHDKFSTSKKNVLRGIHGDSRSWKLVTCVYGDIQQVVVDLRIDSSTYLEWEDFTINKNNQLLILMPPNIGNAYYVNSTEAVYHYKYAYDGGYVDVDEQFSVNWNDKKIGIKWLSNSPILSKRDTEAKSL